MRHSLKREWPDGMLGESGRPHRSVTAKITGSNPVHPATSGALGKQVGFQIRPARFDSLAVCRVVAIYNSCIGLSVMGWHEGTRMGW